MSWMDWFRRDHYERFDVPTPRPPVSPNERVNTDRGTIPLNDPQDATSLMFQLAMRYDSVHVDGTTVHVAGRSWSGETPLEALQNAMRDLECD